MQGQVDLAGLFAHGFELLRSLRKPIGRAVEPERRFAAALQTQAPDLLALADRQCDLIELPVGAIGFQHECQRLIIADPLRLLDCVMRCDGGNAFLVMSTERARSLGFTRFVRRKLEGHTGDTLGATQQLAEAAFLVSLAFLI